VQQMAEDTLIVMNAAGIRSAHIVGHSLGGLIALQTALSAPERVKSLSLLCTSARGADATQLSMRMVCGLDCEAALEVVPCAGELSLKL
jgi:pimeloyl-ACP methyl ester carboxylesterase